jgi:predicted NBD/HSP70 family sugar kinase
MYLGIDVGGTKTLVATLDDNGVILENQKFPTPQDYQDFLSKLSIAISQLANKDFIAVGIGIPATNINRREGIAISFANLDWHNVPILQDIENLTGCPVALENDAKLAGLSEARLRPNIHRLVYLTISTGIGYSLITDQQIDHNIGDGGGSLMLLEHKGQLVPWESFASGKAIVNTFGLKAHDITDPDTWDKIANNLSVGIIELIAVTEPDLIVVGGSVGVYLDNFKDSLTQKLKSLETPLLNIPPIEAAIRPVEAVVYGCYDYALELYGPKNDQ